MTCNTTLRNNLVNGHRKRGSDAISVAEDDSQAGCCGEETSIEQRFKETRMDVLRHTAADKTEEVEDMPKQEVDRGSKKSGGTGSKGTVCRNGREEQADWQEGERIKDQCTGGGSMGRHSMGGQSMGGQNMGGQSMETKSRPIGVKSIEEERERRGQRKLILHFDIRNTILVADSVTKVKVEQALNTFLTGVTWGREDSNGSWEWLSKTPSLRRPCDGAITYYKHLESKLAQVPEDRDRLRQKTGNFAQDTVGQDFRPDFDKHLHLLSWNHDAPDKMLTMEGSDGCRYHYLLPSFVRLLYQLEEDGRDFAIVLRTYGMDARNVLSCLQYIVNGNHPDFPGLALSIDVRRDPGRVHRHVDGPAVEFEVVKDENGVPEVEKTYNDELQIYRMLSGSRGVTGFVDDFDHWQRNGYSHRAGKPFWIDLEDDAVQHVFFDDNIRVTADDSIVDVRLATTGSGSSFESIGLNRMSDFENACLVQADLLESIHNVDYFVEKVRTCESNYARLTSDSDGGRSLDWNGA